MVRRWSEPCVGVAKAEEDRSGTARNHRSPTASVGKENRSLWCPQVKTRSFPFIRSRRIPGSRSRWILWSSNEAALLFLMNRCVIFARRPVINFRWTSSFDELNHRRRFPLQIWNHASRVAPGPEFWRAARDGSRTGCPGRGGLSGPWRSLKIQQIKVPPAAIYTFCRRGDRDD